MNKKTKKIAVVAVVAALYTAVSLLLAPISYGNIQVRIAECLTLLPLIWEPGILAVTLGCFLTNLIGAMTGANILGFLDVFIGTLATYIAAVLTFKTKDLKIKNIPVIAILMPVIANGVIIGAELGYALFEKEMFLTGSLICGLEVAAGELVSVIVGYFVMKALKKRNIFED